MTEITRLSLQTQTDLRQQSNVEVDSPRYITLTRTATLAIAVSPGTTITWQSEVRSSGGFTWSGTNVTIPMSGYYHLDFVFELGSGAAYTVELLVDGVAVSRPGIFYSGGTVGHAMVTRFYSAGSTVALRVSVAASRTMLVNAYGTANESPFLHIVKV